MEFIRDAVLLCMAGLWVCLALAVFGITLEKAARAFALAIRETVETESDHGNDDR